MHFFIPEFTHNLIKVLLDYIGVKRSAVGKDHSLAQVKGIIFTVLADIPEFSQAGNNFAFLVILHQRLIQKILSKHVVRRIAVRVQGTCILI